jgi:hypothetical protein
MFPLRYLLEETGLVHLTGQSALDDQTTSFEPGFNFSNPTDLTSPASCHPFTVPLSAFVFEFAKITIPFVQLPAMTEALQSSTGPELTQLWQATNRASNCKS